MGKGRLLGRSPTFANKSHLISDLPGGQVTKAFSILCSNKFQVHVRFTFYPSNQCFTNSYSYLNKINYHNAIAGLKLKQEDRAQFPIRSYLEQRPLNLEPLQSAHEYVIHVVGGF